jgi:hypothetical protein
MTLLPKRFFDRLIGAGDVPLHAALRLTPAPRVG